MGGDEGRPGAERSEEDEEPRLLTISVGRHRAPEDESTPSRRRKWRERAERWCDPCDACDLCDLPCGCDLSLLLLGPSLHRPTLSVASALTVAARLVPTVLPGRAGSAVTRAALVAYRRHLTRFTPRCPSTPSCSAYALAALDTHALRPALLATATHVRSCGR